MLTIDKKYKKDINALVKLVRSNQEKEDVKYRALCKKLKIDPDSEDGNIIWDHVYNGSDWMFEYKE